MNGSHLAAVAATAWIGLLHSSQAETVTLRFGQIPSTVRGTSSVYLHIAEQKGFFPREQIKLERITIPGVRRDADRHAIPDPGGFAQLRCGRYRQRNRQFDLQPDREAGD